MKLLSEDMSNETNELTQSMLLLNAGSHDACIHITSTNSEVKPFKPHFEWQVDLKRHHTMVMQCEATRSTHEYIPTSELEYVCSPNHSN